MITFLCMSIILMNFLLAALVYLVLQENTALRRELRETRALLLAELHRLQPRPVIQERTPPVDRRYWESLMEVTDRSITNKYRSAA